MSRTFVIVVLAAALSACANTATDATAEGDDVASATAEGDPAAAAAAGTKKPKKRCYRDRSTNSRIGVRVCKTVEE